MNNKKSKYKKIPLHEIPVSEPEIVKIKKFEVKGKTPGQEELIDTINECDITLCSGPAGSGKSFCPLGLGFAGLKQGKYDRLILIRPFQECGRNMGALPGEMYEKIAPNMKAFTELFSYFAHPTEILEFVKDKKLTIETVEFLRGLTFHKSFIVIDEAQNCTYEQLKMLLTRIGRGSKMVISGDLKQTDLPEKMWKFDRIPLDFVIDKLYDLDVPQIGVVELTEDDIVRHGLIKLICGALP